jgi:hypothetical protein
MPLLEVTPVASVAASPTDGVRPVSRPPCRPWNVHGPNVRRRRGLTSEALEIRRRGSHGLGGGRLLGFDGGDHDVRSAGVVPPPVLRSRRMSARMSCWRRCSRPGQTISSQGQAHRSYPRSDLRGDARSRAVLVAPLPGSTAFLARAPSRPLSADPRGGDRADVVRGPDLPGVDRCDA